ncbi:hypothetical protein [Saccharopolyspora pogona]|uniref:hypothetical protein n=1 Tax=Saccharopolyspora pogona TaxID=333966 RepID=UPI001CC23213|nr:hypothetical protein [Saccharopolyspora pogona]
MPKAPCSFRGGWLDPSNVINRISGAFDECGYSWVTSHVFRKTVATVLDEAGLPIGDVANQLGNTRKIAEKHYIARKVSNKNAANALETITVLGSKDPIPGRRARARPHCRFTPGGLDR